MKLKEIFQRAWENKEAIAEGLYNTYVSNNHAIKEEAARRLAICQANTCGFWDSTGTHQNLVVKGQPGCTGCGCNGQYKTAAMSSHCYLKDIGKEPLWDAIMTPDQETEIQKMARQKYEQQIKK